MRGCGVSWELGPGHPMVPSWHSPAAGVLSLGQPHAEAAVSLLHAVSCVREVGQGKAGWTPSAPGSQGSDNGVHGEKVFF